MIKTIYLNFDLQKEDELEAYSFFENLGRAKKKFIMALLVKHGFVAPLDSKKKKEDALNIDAVKAEAVKMNVKERRTDNIPEAVERKVQEAKEILQSEPKLQPEPLPEQLSESQPKQQEHIPREPVAFSGTGEDWQSYFTPEQVQEIQAAGHDMSIAKPNMLQSMREHMENGVPVVAAYSIAAFDNRD